MSNRFERTIQFFDVSINGHTRARDLDPNHKKFASPRTLDELMKDIIAIRELGMTRRKAGKKSVFQFSLEDIEEREDCWALLINLVDSNSANVVTNKIDGAKEDRQLIEFSDDQGLESSAHVVIFKQKNTLKKHLMLFEKSQNVPFAKAASFMNFMARTAAGHFREVYERPHPAGNPKKTMHTYCMLELMAHPSEEFTQELKSGKLTGIRLTSDVVMLKGYESKKQPELIGTEVKVDVQRGTIFNSGGNIKHLKKALKHAKELSVPFVKVSFDDETGSGHTATLDVESEALIEKDKYVKKRKITGFLLPLATAVPVIHTEIVNQMINLKDD